MKKLFLLGVFFVTQAVAQYTYVFNPFTGKRDIASSGGGGGSVTSVSGTGTVSGVTLTGTVTGSGNLALGGTLSVGPTELQPTVVTPGDYTAADITVDADGRITAAANGSGSGAPNDANYLVGTDNAGLSADIAVGTTPGGELGGSWALPTIDDTLTVVNWTLTTPRFADLGYIADSGGNELIIFDLNSSAVNEFTISNGSTTANPKLKTSGGDTNIGIDFEAKGSGTFRFLGNATQAGTIKLHEITGSGTNFASFAVPALTADTAYTLPPDDGDAGEQLQTDGSGVLTWESAGAGGGDADAIHDNVSGEIAAVADKATPVAADHILIEDSAATDAKKDITVGSQEAALEGVMDLQDLQGAIVDAQVPDTITIDLATTATNVADADKGDISIASGVWGVDANSVALTTDTTGSYAAGDAEAGAALTGDTATAFFSAGQIERARGGTNADTSATGVGLFGSDGSNVFVDVDTVAELETAVAGANIIQSTEIDTAAEVNTLVGDDDFVTLAGTQTITGSKIFGPITLTNGVAWADASMGALEVDTAEMENTKSISADSVLTFSAEPATGARFGLRLTNSDTAAHTITIPSSTSEWLGAARTTFVIPALSTVTMEWRHEGSGAYRIFGEPISILDLTAAAVVAADSFEFYDATDGLHKRETFTNLIALTLTSPTITGTTTAAAANFSGLVTANASATIGNGSTTAGVLKLLEDTDAGANFASFQVPSLAANTVYTLPADDGDAGEQLQTDGAGALTWEAAGSGSGAPTDADYLVGTANGSLSAEIVMGTAPGGELGGSWASPTVDDGITIDSMLLTTKVNVPNGTADATLSTAGDFHFNTTDEQLSFHTASDGEVTGEVSISVIQHFAVTFDPKAICDGAVDRLFLFKVGDQAPEGIVIDEWSISFEADPTTEVDMDLKRADAMIGVANAAVMDALDTTAGAAVEDTDANINAGAVITNGQVLYLEFATAYTEANHQIMVNIWYHAEED